MFLWEPEVIDRVYTLPAQPEHETASQTLNNSSAIHIVIADDHPVVRRGVKQILEEQPDMKVVGEAQDAIETLELIHKQPCHILILDLAMPGGGGMGVLRQLQREGSQLPVLVLSIQSAEQYAQQVLRAGAAGYLTKESAPEELVSPSGMVESPRLLGEGKFGEM
ncbi:response regulator transcription factor [Candidatus Acetothermia bacterium]|nr:response regulator transcription factor [Candidatus Acetothermia bacterium]